MGKLKALFSRKVRALSLAAFAALASVASSESASAEIDGTDTPVATASCRAEMPSCVVASVIWMCVHPPIVIPEACDPDTDGCEIPPPPYPPRPLPPPQA